MEEVDIFKEQAEYFANVPIIEPQYKASVHLENEDDERFWDILLQKNRPGRYNYIYQSKSKEGKDTSGCAQCLKYKDYLCKRFFICIDSDFRYLFREDNLDALHHIYQTYTYSWENHYCFSTKLQHALNLKCPEFADKFDFIVFLRNYSSALYEALILFLSMHRKGFQGFGKNKFKQLLPNQCRWDQLADNAVSLTNEMRDCINKFIEPLKVSCNFDINIEKDEFPELTEENAYLHVRGHNLYNLVVSIGNLLCDKNQINFVNDILLDILQTEGYWEIDKIGYDLNLCSSI